MRGRDAFWVGGIALLATLGGVAAYSAVGPGTPASEAGLSSRTAAEPVRRAVRIDAELRATLERLAESAIVEEPAEPSPPAATLAPVTLAEDIPAAPLASPQPVSRPTAPPLANPAPGMPVSLMPGRPWPEASERPRVMDWRLVALLDQLGSAPRARMPGVLETMAAEEAPIVLHPPAAAPAPEGMAPEGAALTADDLNARELRRISGGAN